MQAKKIFLLIVLIALLGLSLWFSLSLSAAKDKDKESSEADKLGVVYQDSFLQWRDDATDPGFNTTVEKKGGNLVVATARTDYGKAMSQYNPISMKITDNTQLVVKVGQVAKQADVSFRIQKAYEPFETVELFRLQNGKAGEFKVNLMEATGWKNETDMWFEIWLAGKNSKLVIEDIHFWDEAFYQEQVKQKAMKDFTRKKFKALPKGNIFYEDFRKGINGWRTEASDMGFGSELDFAGKYPRLRMVPGKRYCKLMSPADAIKTEITSNTQLEVALGDMGTSKMKVELMISRDPYTAYTLIPDITKDGIYVMNISEKTEWEGPQEFWIQIWLGSEQDPETEKGAEIKHIRVFDAQKSDTPKT
ncbi:hypothetical protein JW933_05020 [candidate division FCPU426 bacterium]|nr:hypothetical protein [candidate division FCPU426 bacterium]